MSQDFYHDFISKRGEHTASFHGTWYRGEHTHFIPSKAELQEPYAVENFILYGWLPSKPFITKTTRITAFGSCFAARISDYLSERGYLVLGGDLGLAAHIVRFGEGMVNTFAIRQQIEWGLGDREFPENLWFGPNKEIATVDPEVRQQTHEIITTADVFIITLGLSEIWYDKQSGDAFWRAIPAEIFDNKKHGFRLSTVDENVNNIRAVHKCIRRSRPEVAIIFTLSPIPLAATFRPISCLTANTVSKAILRVAIDQFMTSVDDANVYYFPSYEIIHEMFPDWRLENNRHPRPEAIRFVMNTFERYYCEPLSSSEPNVAPKRGVGPHAVTSPWVSGLKARMPDLSTNFHLDALDRAKLAGQPERDGLYGLQWGDPQREPWLRFVRDEFLLPFVHPDRVGVEIGPGGGRWTRYLLTLSRLYAVDLHQELLDELARNFRTPGLFLVKNTGTDFPLIELRSVDLVFSFDVFVHLDIPIIKSYLDNIKTIIRPGADVIIQYSDKTKKAARENLTFSDNDPTRMCAVIAAGGYRIVREDRDKLPHSSIVHFTMD
jgi:hypothetical protein